MALITVSRSAIFFTFSGAFIIIIAFSTSHWLVSDLDVPKIRFTNLGLWNICLKDFQDPLYLYDMKFNGCRYILIEDLWFLREQILEPAFFVAVQVLFTLSLVFVLVACVLVILYYLCCGPEYYLVLFATSLDLIVAAFLGTIAVLVFGARGDGRDWMPDPDHNYLSWSFGLAVIGIYFLWNAALLFYIEARRLRKQEKKEEQGMYGMSGHSKA